MTARQSTKPAKTRHVSRSRAASSLRGPLTAEELRKIDAYWRASNYLSVGQIYLLDNPLLRSR